MSVSPKIRSLSIGAAVVLALAGCAKAPEQKVEAAPAFKLDESQLLQPIRFSAADLDATKSACTDLAAYANDKWLAANPIPDDQVRWGAFNVLRERSLQVQKQLAEQIAAQAHADGHREDRRGPVGHRHGRQEAQCRWHLAARRPTGGDREAHGQRGHRRLPAQGGRPGREPAVRLRLRSGLQEFVDEHRLRRAGRHQPARQDLLLRRRQEGHPRGLRGARRQGAGAVGRAGRRCGHAGEAGDGVRDAPGQGVASRRKTSRATCRCTTTR